MKSFTQLFKYIIATFILVAICDSVYSQDSSRMVKSRKVFVCEMERDTFKTAEEGCRHWSEKHLPGYKYESHEITDNGAVKCICTKAGESDNDQQGKIYGIILCPVLATEVNDETPFMKKMCECPTPGYIAQNDKCVPLKPKSPPKTTGKNK